MTDIVPNNIQEELESELEYLKQKLDMAHHLKVIWAPQQSSRLCGEVKNGYIYVYDMSKQDAIKTLRHEFLDYVVSQAVEPYKKVVNTFIHLYNKEAYERKEKFVEGLTRLFE